MRRFIVSCIFTLFTLNSINAVTIGTVPIGNPGNPADWSHRDPFHYPKGPGSVAYPFMMGKTEITNAQYVEFLNSVAASDPYGLYNDFVPGNELWGGIVRSGLPGSFTYAVKAPALGGNYKYNDKPVIAVSWGDTARFANWLHNGQPSGPQDLTTTEDGSYTLNGATTDDALAAATRNPGARWWVPNDDEWYKAAYYDPSLGVYYEYPTGSDGQPNNNRPASDTGNSANIDIGGANLYPLTDVGAYKQSGSPYNTFDQGGNVWELVETFAYLNVRGIRGGAFNSPGFYLSTQLNIFSYSWDVHGIGFRVASAIPEPNPLILVMVGSVLAWGRRDRPTRRN